MSLGLSLGLFGGLHELGGHQRGDRIQLPAADHALDDVPVCGEASSAPLLDRVRSIGRSVDQLQGPEGERRPLPSADARATFASIT